MLKVVWITGLYTVIVGMGLWSIWERAEIWWGLWFIVGVLLWTFAEYWFHRYLHTMSCGRIEEERGMKGFADSGDGIGGIGSDIDNHHHHHHLDPADEDEIHYTFAESLIGASTVLGLLWLVFGKVIGIVIWSGFVMTYVLYEWVHLSAHRDTVVVMPAMSEYHREHHRLENGTRFGFLTDFWYRVFGTAGDKD